MKKKVVSLVMVCMLAFGMMTGCGNKDTAKTDNTTKRSGSSR